MERSLVWSCCARAIAWPRAFRGAKARFSRVYICVYLCPSVVACDRIVTATTITPVPAGAAERASFVREHLPAEGLFADHDWRTSPDAFPLGPALAKEVESLGRVLLQFYRAVNLLYRKSVEGKQPAWVARWLDLGKPAELVELQRSAALKNELPRVIRPDLLITDQGLKVTELDSVPGGIGLTGWLNQTYSQLGAAVLGGADGMSRGFASIFADAPRRAYRRVRRSCHLSSGDELAVQPDGRVPVQGSGCAVQRVRRRRCGPPMVGGSSPLCRIRSAS
jgi:hypothetical protein